MAVSNPYPSGAQNVTLTGDELVIIAGRGPQVQQAKVNQLAAGGSAYHGTFVANGATPVVVPNVNVTADSVINITLKTLGGSQGAQPTVTAKTAGVSFGVTCTAGDTSTYNYQIFG